MTRRLAVLGIFFVLAAPAASAHVAFSSVDVRLNGPALDVTVVVQAFDVAHELGIDPPERLTDLAFAATERDAMARLIESELDVSADGEVVSPGAWSLPAVAPEQQLIRLSSRYQLRGTPGRLEVRSRLFAYDTSHQTLVNVYEQDQLRTQQLLDAGRVQFEYFTNTRAGLASLSRWFGVAGVQRALSAYDHLLFLVALVLLGGTSRRLLTIIGAFALASSVGFWLGASASLAIAAVIVPPGVALSVVYAGVDNVMVRGKRDVRVWTALGFGWVHGLAFAAALNAIDRPAQKFAWAAAWFNIGVEAGLLLAAVGIASLLALLPMPWKHRTAIAGSVLVAGAGVASFIERIVWR